MPFVIGRNRETLVPPNDSRLGRWAAGLLLLVAGLACAVSPFLTLDQAHQPFPGFLVEPSMVISGVGRSSWAGRTAGLVHPWRIVAADGQPVARPGDLNAYLRTLPLGTPVRYTAEDPSGQRQVWPETVPTAAMPAVDKVLLFWIPYFVALAYLACGIWVFRARRNDVRGQACAILCAAVSLTLCLFFDALTGDHLTRLWVSALPLSAAAAIHLGLVFPQPLPFARQAPRAAWSSYLPAAGLILWAQIVHASPSQPRAYFLPWRYSYLFIVLSTLFAIGSLAFQRRFARNALIRQQARSVFFGALLAFVPTAAWFAGASLRFDVNPFLPLIYLPLATFPFTLSYAITREQLLDVDHVLRKALAYSLLALLLAGLYTGMAGLIGWLYPGFLQADDPLTLAFLVIVAALLVSPIQRRLRAVLDRLLYREQVNFRRVVQEFGQSLGQVIDLPELSNLILQRVAAVLHLDAASLYLFDPRSGTYILYKALGPLKPEEAPAFAETDAFIQRLRSSPGAVYRHNHTGSWLPTLPEEDQSYVNQLQALVFLPLMTKHDLAGWLNLGARLSGERYNAEDLELLDALADRAAVAIENARLFAERERRLTELAVLNEIGQAINSALSLEQVLETIYRETGRLMDTTNFYIALYEPEKDEVSFALAFEGGKRRAIEPRRRGNGLTEYLLRTQQPLLIAERVEETILSLGADLAGPPANSWLGVPIMHENQSIGVIGTWSVEESATYDVTDLAILSAIANQAAIAIQNARLYESTDRALSRRLVEITVLAEFARSLTSVALDPRQVAEQTLLRAVNALQADGGILALCDQTSGAFTPLAQLHWPASESKAQMWRSLLPDLPSATFGILCHTQDSGQALPDSQTTTQLLCPLIREETLLAVLHLALPRGCEPDEESRRFLRHLADHAAIALENALLYEKQVQQREALDSRAQHLTEILDLSNALRANMDLDQVLQFVVEAARDTLGFHNAVLSLVDEKNPDHLRRVAAVGLDAVTFRRLQAQRPPLRSYQDVMRPELRVGHSYMIGPEDAARLQQTGASLPAESTEPDRFEAGEWTEQCALLVPLRGTEDRLLGVLSVDHPEDRKPPSQDTIDILEILANQAAVAIENAHLFQALRQAYEAKGESLSLVAHELQVPMGTLRGYAELLEREGDQVDPDTLRGFVRVLQVNIGRLDALLRDLLEVSRIEAGTMQLRMEPLDLSEVILDSAATFRPQMQRKGLAFSLDVREGLSTFADRDRLAQVVDNLLSNALKYTPSPGSISVAARVLQGPGELNGAGPEQFPVRCPCVLVSVRDTGIGLSQQEQKRLFTRFFRADHPLVYQQGGTGLGLYLVRLLVEQHKGQVWATSEPGIGSTFLVALPLAES